MPDDDELVELLATAALAVAQLVASASDRELEGRLDGHDDQYWIDIEADRVVREILEPAGLGVLSEESGRHGPDSSIVVVVDPIDGSTNCSRRISHYGPSLCAIDDGGLRAAVVHNIHTATTYRAARGKGASRNGLTIDLRPRPEPYVLMTGDPCPELDGPMWTRVSGASAHDLCLVADGSVDGYVDHRNTQSVWDYVGAMLILTESGGAVRERNGAQLVDLGATGADRKLIAATSLEHLNSLMRVVEERLPIE